MRLCPVAVVLLAAFSTSARAEINLTPQQSFRELEGCKFPQLEFHDDAGKVTYEPPPGWSAVSRGRHTLTLVPAGKDMTSARIAFLPTPARLILDEAQLAALKSTAHQLLPPNAQPMAEPTVAANPMLLGGHPTCELQMEFTLHAERMRMAVLLVDLGETQLRFTLMARQPEFEELHGAFRNSWYSWQWHGTPAGAVAKVSSD